MDERINFICEKGHNRFPNPEKTALLLQTATRIDVFKDNDSLAKYASLV